MSRFRRLKKELGDAYAFWQEISAREIAVLMTQKLETESVIATLTAGVVRLDAVIARTPEGNRLTYDLLVQDSCENPVWICFEDIPGELPGHFDTLEREMFRILDEAVERNGLSYTQPMFSQIPGKTPLDGKAAPIS